VQRPALGAAPELLPHLLRDGFLDDSAVPRGGGQAGASHQLPPNATLLRLFMLLLLLLLLLLVARHCAGSTMAWCRVA